MYSSRQGYRLLIEIGPPLHLNTQFKERREEEYVAASVVMKGGESAYVSSALRSTGIGST